MQPIGYSYLNRYYKLLLPKLGLEVYIDNTVDTECIRNYGSFKRKLLPRSRKFIDCPYEQMISAIKYQGIRLHYFSAIFNNSLLKKADFSAFLAKKPNSKYNRVLWFLYEWLTNSKLDLPDLKSGNYIQLFEEKYYYTLKNGNKNKRTRVINNAIGTQAFCPTVRKTLEVKNLAKIDVYDTAWAKMQTLGDFLSSDVIGRSINYLYTKETKSSTEIEHEKPDKKKMQRFLNAIKNAGLFELTKEKIIDLQNQIVEDKARVTDYRTSEIYVGSTIQRLNFIDEDVHYVGVLAKYVPEMMEGLLSTHDNLMLDGRVPPLIHAAIISFGEVYIHPMDDGNGRIHRYLIHDVMKQREPEHKFIIPISAAILKNTAKYDAVLESISKPVMAMLEWELDTENNNRLIIHNDIDYMYRYPDYTEHVKFTYEMMNSAISDELISEICLLIAFDRIKRYINDIADIPNNKLDKITSIIINAGGKASKQKRAFIEKHIEHDCLPEVEAKSTQLLKEIKDRFNIDIKSLMRKLP
ncbi:Fic family protein [Pleionea mediterranea]|uniref:Fic/DOC family protein n=1 Tax=Pleionea mediterranea TaxID=523701 RepID=A0A316FBJ1_9GAMM|nr:Fic family protein [Pleionea mediterranea]PWK42823.1 Fic/DOC family protein [Pleionea mediterranea]